MKIKLGIAPIAWSNDDMPELGGDTPIESCLSEACSAGFKGIELGGKFPRNPGIIKFLLNKYNLSLPGGWYGSKLKEKYALARVYIYPSTVQGSTAPKSLARMLDKINKDNIVDVVLIVRGGGSLQDLMAFVRQIVILSLKAFLFFFQL